MGHLSELGQLLHEEHFRTLMLACDIENRVSAKASRRPIDPTNAEDRELLDRLLSGLGEIGGHNAFEENVLFPLIRNDGSAELSALLRKEHAQMAPMVQRLMAVARDIRAGGSTDGTWREFCATGRDLVAELMFHLEKEEIVIVQQLDAYLEPSVDHALALRYQQEAHRRSGEATIHQAA